VTYALTVGRRETENRRQEVIMTNSTPNTQTSPTTPITDILMGTLAVLLARGLCLGRHYSVGYTHRATGEVRMSVLNLQGSPMREYTDLNNDTLFEAAYLFATLESLLPLGVGDDVTPQYAADRS
jgi:hypothetical protein